MTNFASNVEKIGSNMDELMRLSGEIDNLKGVSNLLSQFNQKELNLLSAGIDEIKYQQKNIGVVANGLGDIKNVVSIQNQVSKVSDNIDLVSQSVGSIGLMNNIIDQRSNMDYVIRNEKHYLKLISMHSDIEAAIEISKEIESVASLAEDLKKETSKIEKLKKKAEAYLAESKEVLVNVINVKKSLAKDVEFIRSAKEDMVTLDIDVNFLEYGTESHAEYILKTNTLRLYIQEGRPGIRGEAGIDGRQGVPGSAVQKGDRGEKGDSGDTGRDLVINQMGNLSKRKKFGNRPIGFSFLALDKTPTMLYFRKSNTLDDWTDGIPFGASDGVYARNAGNTERFMGMSLAEFTTYIQNRLGVQNGN